MKKQSILYKLGVVFCLLAMCIMTMMLTVQNVDAHDLQTIQYADSDETDTQENTQSEDSQLDFDPTVLKAAQTIIQNCTQLDTEQKDELYMLGLNDEQINLLVKINSEQLNGQNDPSHTGHWGMILAVVILLIMGWLVHRHHSRSSAFIHQ